jgi:hypothetical protein
MAGPEEPIRTSRVPESARKERTDRSRRDHPLAPFLAIVGASLPRLVYDALIKNPAEFWTFKGLIVLAAVAMGVILFGLSWHFSRGLSDRDG